MALEQHDVDPSAPARRPDRPYWAWLAGLIALSALPIAPFLAGGLLTDDFPHLENLSRAAFVDLLRGPDAFGFYRPVAQVSLYFQHVVLKLDPAAMRAANLLIHLAVIVCAWVVARLLLGDSRRALFAATAFALTPKAPAIAVMWISARAELLMALFALLSVMCWVLWDQRGGRSLLLGAWVCYVFAFLSKETAALLPLLLLALAWWQHPPGRRQLAAVLVLVLTGLGIMALRMPLGALMPTSGDQHYAMATPLFRWSRNIRNYFPRALPSPVALLACVALPAALVARRERAFSLGERRSLLGLCAVAGTWFLLLILPVVPIAARSELYLYLPGFGFCLVAGSVTGRLWEVSRSRRYALAGLLVCVAGMAGYQVQRAARTHERLVLSASLVEAVRSCPDLRKYSGAVLLVPDSPETERMLKDAIGGYFATVLRRALNRDDITGAMVPAGSPEDDGQHDARYLHSRREASTITLGCGPR
jgi:hypothetical protein